MPDQAGYPTEEELAIFDKYVDKHDYVHQEEWEELIENIESFWWMPDWGFKLEENEFGEKKLELHTGGWSGNEEIIGLLRRTMFWRLYWMRSDRGGHYYFTLPKLVPDGNQGK